MLLTSTKLALSACLAFSGLVQESVAPGAGGAAPQETASGATAAPAADSFTAPAEPPASGAGETAAPATDGGGEGAPAAAPARPPESPFGIQQIIPFAIMGLLFYFILIRPQQREHRRRQELLNTLKKNDKVVTNSGLIGTIADISADGRTVTLKVDDSTRIKFLRSAIQGPLDDKVESSGNA